MRGILGIAIALVVIWAVAWLVFKTVGFAIHLLLLAAIVMFVWAMLKRGAGAVRRRV